MRALGTHSSIHTSGAACSCLQAHTACVAGVCLAVGIRFAGSANARAEALLRRYAQHLLAAKQRMPEPGTGGRVGGWVGGHAGDLFMPCSLHVLLRSALLGSEPHCLLFTSRPLSLPVPGRTCRPALHHQQGRD